MYDKIKDYKFLEVQKILTKNGFHIKRYAKGNHIVFEDDKLRTIVIPRKTTINRMLFRRLVKENSIDVNL